MSLPPTPFVSDLLKVADLKWFYSGGTFNSDPAKSLGGEISATEYVSGTLNGLFDLVESNEAVLGDVEYRCVYLKNTHVDRALLGCKVWIESGTPSNTTAIAISVGAGGINGSELLVPDENTAPTTQTFETVLSEPVVANIGDLGPGDRIAIWIRYFVAPNTVTTANEVSVIRVDGEREPELAGLTDPVFCPEGTHYVPATNSCVDDPIECPPNTTYNPSTGTCVPSSTLPQCPTNYHYDAITNRCILNSAIPPPVPIVQFAIAGDFDCVQDTDETFASIRARIPITGPAEHLGLFFPIGDLSYGDSQDCFIELCQTLGSGIYPNLIYPVIGNHDDEEDGSAAKRQQIINTFPNIPSRGYYAFTKGNIRFIGIDTQISYASGSAQHTFILSELQQAAGTPAIKWKIVYYHKPSLISDTTHEALTDFRNIYHPLFDTYKVDVIFTGHAHVYFRSKPVKHNPTTPALPLVQSTQVNGIYNMNTIDGRFFVTSGTGGRESNHTFTGTAEPYVAIRTNTHFGSVFGTLQNSGTELKLEFISNDGQIVDSCLLAKPTAIGTTLPATCPPGYYLDTALDLCVIDTTPPGGLPPTQPVLKIGFVGDTTTATATNTVFTDLSNAGIHQLCHLGDLNHAGAPATTTGYMTTHLSGTIVSNAMITLGDFDHVNESGTQPILDYIIDFFNLNVATEYCTKKKIQNVYIISMNTQDTNVAVDGGTQDLFVEAALGEASIMRTAGTVDWIIVLVHKPLICATSNHVADEEGARSLYQTMFNTYEVDFVISGHNHVFEISHPLIDNTTTQYTETDTGYDFRQPHGQIYIVAGTGGTTRDTHTLVPPEFRYANDNNFGSVIMTVDTSGKNITVQARSSAGTILHSFIVTKGAITPPPPLPCPTGQHRDVVSGLCVPDVVPPGPGGGGQLDSRGIRWLTATGQQGLIPQSRDTASDDRWSSNITGATQYGWETTMILTFNGASEGSHFAMKAFGPNHSAPCGYEEDGSCCCWYDLGIRGNGDIQLQTERPHPSNHNFTLPATQQFITNIGVPMEGSTIGLKWVIHPMVVGGDVDHGGVRVRMWVDTTGLVGNLPANNWRLAFDFIDTGQILGGYPAPDEQELEIRNSDTTSQTAYGGGFHYRMRTAADVGK